ncbi:MAG: hypothetical protein IPP83_07735 [Flavobacteriales bacterium]|nr:hypothetical protein [Flavobacteriales bacterium]
MRSFLTILMGFCVPPLIWCTAMALWNVHTMRQETLRLPARTVAMGDSHISNDIDADLLAGARNIALPAEPYLLTWYKLKQITTHHRIDTLLLGFSPNNLSDKDLALFREDTWATERLMVRIYPLVPFCEALRLPLHRQTYLRTLFMRLCTWPRTAHAEYIGSFAPLKVPYHPDAGSTLKRHFEDNAGQVAPVSDVGIAYLDSIVLRCRRDSMVLYLVGTPLHPTYRRGIPPALMAEYDALKHKYVAWGVQVLDHINLYNTDSLFANSDHLNAAGARSFTRLVSAEMGRPPIAPGPPHPVH